MITYEERILNLYFKDDTDAMEDAKKRLKNCEPLAYIVGETAFYNEMFFVTPDTLIPRPDTEHVVEKIVKSISTGGVFADLCCGSGAIGVSALCNSKASRALLVDISDKAIAVAKKNAKRNGAFDRCEFICSDLNDLVLPDLSFDIIASNPPYVRTDVIPTLEKECSYEPYIAFDGGADGMYFYDLILKRFSGALKVGGSFIFEIGYDQAQDIKLLADKYGYNLQIFKDYGGNDRVAILKK